MDDTYPIYLSRLAQMALPQAYENQVQSIQASTKFHHSPSGSSQAASVPGYTIITPPQSDESINSQFYLQLETYQQKLLALDFGADLMVSLPLASFHLTLADLIVGSAYENACDRDANYEVNLRTCIEKIFKQYQQQYPQPQAPIKWRMQSLIVMPRAIGVALAPESLDDYEQIINFRRLIYQSSELAALGIAQQYHFTAHVTLAYFKPIPVDLNRDRVAELLAHLNQSWLNTMPEFIVDQAELRKFDDMNSFYRQPDWTKVNFG
ncbi:MAG: DUF1868 domain-containing protein [Cyanobacteria bacterium J06659_2]